MAISLVIPKTSGGVQVQVGLDRGLGAPDTCLMHFNVTAAAVLARPNILRRWRRRDSCKLLATLIRWADANPDEAIRLGQAARERIRARYDWEKVADAHDSFFRAVAARHGIPISQRPFPSELGA